MLEETTATVTPTEPDTSSADTQPEVTETAQTVENTEAKKDNSIPISRFNEVYADKKRLERQLEMALAGRTETVTKPAETVDALPDPKNYEGREAQYYSDLAAHSARQEWAKMNQQQAQQTQATQFKQAQETASQNYLSKVSVEVAKEPALAAELALLDTIQWPAQTALLLEGHDNAGLLAKHLARNLQEAHQLAALAQTNPMAAAVKIGELGAKLQGSPQPVKMQQKSQAPAPIETLNGGGKKTPGYVPGESSVSDYIKAYYPPPG